MDTFCSSKANTHTFLEQTILKYNQPASCMQKTCEKVHKLTPLLLFKNVLYCAFRLAHICGIEGNFMLFWLLCISLRMYPLLNMWINYIGFVFKIKKNNLLLKCNGSSRLNNRERTKNQLAEKSMKLVNISPSVS